MAELRVGVHGEVSLHIVAVGVVVLGLAIPCEGSPLLNVTTDLLLVGT